MAASFHTRSNSFPTRSHALTSEVAEHLRRLSSSQDASTSSTTICHKLNGLQDLHESVNKMLQLPLIQQALAQGQNKKWVDELLNGSLRTLDICGIAQNVLLQIKESVQGLQSVLRRQRGDDTELTCEIKKYLASRKTVKKAIQKALGNLKGMENKRSLPINEERVSILKEVETVTLAAFESLLSFIWGPKTPSKLSRFSMVSKLINSERIAYKEDENDINESENVDAALSTLIGHKTSKSDNIQIQLKELEFNIQDLEEGLESMSRCLIKARVSLLNILTN